MSTYFILHVYEHSYVIFLAVFLPTFSSNFLTFRNSDDLESFPEEIISTNDKLVNWSAAWPTDVRLLFFNASTLNLQLSCTLDIKSEDDETTDDEEFQVFFEYPDPFINESVILNRSCQACTINLNDVTVDLHVNQDSGIIVSIRNVMHNTSLPLLYFYCKASNRYGKITSNRAHVLDFRKNFPSSKL